MNTEYDPSKDDGDAELVLNVLKTDPLPTVSPHRVVQRTHPGFDKFDAHSALNSLADAGWVYHRERGLYDLIMDPRPDVPSWPVDWGDRQTLPSPLPNQPADRDTISEIHQQYHPSE